jgi:hypothetical protein
MTRATRERLVGIQVGFGVIGILLTAWLVVSQVFVRPTCPPLVGIPACWFVLAGYVSATMGAWLAGERVGDVLFYAGAGAVVLIAIYFSSCQLQGTAQCPTFETLPMCYVSLLAGLTLIALDQVRRRLPVT